MPDNSPLLLLSSGARARYLEDIVRALALPEGGAIQFRYEQSIVSDGVKQQRKSGSLIGRTCYLCYLDNRDLSKSPEIVPVREAVIVDLVERGTSLVFRMQVQRYFRTAELHTTLSVIRNQCLDRLPSWLAGNDPANPSMEGYWVNFLNGPLAENIFIAHDRNQQTHLGYFEDAVRNLITHEQDFGPTTNRLFFNIIGLFDGQGRSINLVNGKWHVKPGRKYRIELYHYYPDEGLMKVRPTFWLCLSTSGVGMAALGPAALKADSEYDSKIIELVTAGSTKRQYNSITIYRALIPADAAASSAELTVPIEIEPDLTRNILQAVVIGVFVAVPSLVILMDHFDTWRAIIICIAALVAGFASVFRFARGELTIESPLGTG